MQRVIQSLPFTSRDWSSIFNSLKLLYCNGTADRFFQGPLEILEEDGTIQFVGFVFSNIHFFQQMNVYMPSVHTLCVDGTYQVRLNHPPGIAQLFTVQIVINNVVNY